MMSANRSASFYYGSFTVNVSDSANQERSPLPSAVRLGNRLHQHLRAIPYKDKCLQQTTTYFTPKLVVDIQQRNLAEKLMVRSLAS